ncbi:MAG TPA: glycosyltransferase, partial [Actinomycetota bacterium]|nr:glycosyltransferase [Actinomycetota bacterium]
AGLPLVGGRAGGVGDAVRDGETGFLVDGRSADETADAVIRILDDSVLRETLGRNARKMAENDFNWEVIFERYEAALGRAINSR